MDTEVGKGKSSRARVMFKAKPKFQNAEVAENRRGAN